MHEADQPTAAASNASAAPSDHSLLRRLRGGSDQAATEIFLRYARRLHALARARCSADLARRVDSDDIVQSAFKSFFRGVSQGYYDVPAGQQLWNLLLVIGLNKIRAQGNFHRAARRDVRRTAGEPLLEDHARHKPSGDENALAVLQMVIAETVERLPASHRPIALLRLEGYEVAEIADRVGRSRRTVERVLQDFRERLAEALDDRQRV